MVERHRYVAAVVFMLIGCVPFVLWGFGIAEPPGMIVGVSVLLILFGPVSAANTYLGYPRLMVSGNLLVLESSPFTSRRVDLANLGAAYLIHYPKNRGIAAELIFRSAQDEAAHRAAEKYPHAPELSEAAETININAIVGHDVAKGEALAGEINAHRGY